MAVKDSLGGDKITKFIHMTPCVPYEQRYDLIKWIICVYIFREIVGQ